MHLEWETDVGEDTIEHRLVSEDPPEPLLNEALKAFVPEMLKLLELPRNSYGEGMRVTGLSLNYQEGGRMGAVVTALKELDATNAPLVLNTPHLPEYDPDDEGPSLSDAMMTLIEESARAAQRYIEGHRSQGNLFDEAA